MALTRQRVLLELKLQLALDFLADDAVISLTAANAELLGPMSIVCSFSGSGCLLEGRDGIPNNVDMLCFF